VNDRATIEAAPPTCDALTERLRTLEDAIHHAAHLLPTQNPIQVFIHHNTLHAFESETFFEAVVHGAEVFGCHPYLAEADYRQKLAAGRITPHDIATELTEDLEASADQPIRCAIPLPA
jgi:uncharacterized protein YbcC (UPF0753/DUF2309 family)